MKQTRSDTTSRNGAGLKPPSWLSGLLNSGPRLPKRLALTILYRISIRCARGACALSVALLKAANTARALLEEEEHKTRAYCREAV